MLNLSFWDGVVLAIATYLAIRVLVRLMVARRDDVIAQYTEQIEQERQRKREREERERRQQARLRQLEALHAAHARAEESDEPQPSAVSEPAPTASQAG